MNLPHKWSVLKTRSSEEDRYLFGADYSKTTFKYSIYITDLSNVWISDVDKEKLEFKALQNGIQRDSLRSVYEMLIKSFENNFEDEKGDDDSETALEIEKFKFDRGIPLELKLKMEKYFKKSDFRWNWSFELTILPDTSSITILKNLIFHMSTVIFSLSEYKSDLVKQLHNKDSAIRFLSETIDSLNSSHMIEKWAKDPTNQGSLQKFDQRYFDEVWREKKLKQLQDRYIWDVLKVNSESNAWSYGTTFKLSEDSKVAGSKREPKGEFAEGDPNSGFGIERSRSPLKKRRVENLDNLNGDFEIYDINEPVDQPKSRDVTTSENMAAVPGSKEPSTERSTPEAQSRSKSPEKKKKTFGVSRKRKVQYKEYSPIKAAKHFQSDE